MATMLGIEIGSSSVKMAELSGRTIRALAEERMPDNMMRKGRPVDVNALAAFLKEMRKAYKFRSRDCALVLPAAGTVTASFNLPAMNGESVMNALPFEFKDYLSGDSDRYLFDYVLADVHRDEKGEPRTMDVFGAAVPKALMEDFYSATKKAGLNLKAAMPAEMAWHNLLNRRTDLPREICLLDMGHRYTDLFIFRDGRFVISKSIEGGGRYLDKIVAEVMNCDVHEARIHQDENTDNVLSSRPVLEAFGRLAVDVMRTLNFYNSDGEGNNLRDIYLCGGGAFLSGMRTAILKSTNMQIHSIERILPGGESLMMRGKCALAIGAAAQPAKEKAQKKSTRRGEKKPGKTKAPAREEPAPETRKEEEDGF